LPRTLISRLAGGFTIGFDGWICQRHRDSLKRFKMDEIFQFRDLQIDIPEINIDENVNQRYISPKKFKEVDERFLKYRNAKQLAKDLKITKNCRHFVFVDGSFFFGDYLEALIVENNYHVKKMIVSTLSMNENNIDSLANLLNGNYVDLLYLVVSDYFFSHERNTLIPYIYQELDVDDKFDIAVCSSHCKIASIQTHCGLNIVIHGSANLRSSSNIEQVCIDESEELCTFVNEVHDNIILEYSTIVKSIRNKKLWQVVQKNSQA